MLDQNSATSHFVKGDCKVDSVAISSELPVLGYMSQSNDLELAVDLKPGVTLSSLHW